MTTISKLARWAAGASLVTLVAATSASAQPLANPLIPSGARGVAREPTGNFLRPRVGVQAAFTDNVSNSSTNKKSDTIGRVMVGMNGRYDSPRAKLDVNGNVVYDVYAKSKKNDSLNANGALAASYIVAPEVLAIEAAAAQTQGSLTTFGSTDFYRAANANDYNVGTYYVGPHLTLSPGVFDLSAAARYGQVFFDRGPAASALNLDETSSFYQVIGAADTKDRLGRVRFVTSGQYQADDKDFESTSGSVSGFYQISPRLTTITRIGYDDSQLSATQDVQALFFSVGGQFTFDESHFRIEGGERYKKPYFAGDAWIRVSRTLNLLANYSITQSAGAISIGNVLVDYVGGLDQPLPLPGSAGSFGLDTTFFSEPSLNRTGRVAAVMDLGRQSFTLAVTSQEQDYQTANVDDFRTLSQELTYNNQVRPDLGLTAAFFHSNGTGNRFLGASTEGDYYQVVGTANYGINSRTNMVITLANRRFRANGGLTTADFDENIGSIALFRQF